MILTRLVSGDKNTFITRQSFIGYMTPCIFINFQEIVDIFEKNGFRLLFKAQCAEVYPEKLYEDNIPDNLKINNTLNAIFKRV